MSLPTAEAMLIIATTTKANREEVEKNTTERGYPFAINAIRKAAECEQTSILFDRLIKTMHGKVNEELFTKMLTDDKFIIYMDKSESIIGRKRVTWDPKVAQASYDLDKPDFARSSEPTP